MFIIQFIVYLITLYILHLYVYVYDVFSVCLHVIFSKFDLNYDLHISLILNE